MVQVRTEELPPAAHLSMWVVTAVLTVKEVQQKLIVLLVARYSVLVLVLKELLLGENYSMDPMWL